MKIAAELCLIGLAVSATDDVSADNSADNQVEGSAGMFHNYPSTYSKQFFTGRKRSFSKCLGKTYDALRTIHF